MKPIVQPHTPCRYRRENIFRRQGPHACIKWAPIVIANPEYSKYGRSITLTEFPDAHCPCGDYK